MNLQQSSFEWAIDFVVAHSDGDLFPKIPELQAAADRKAELAADLAAKPLAALPAGPSRRFIVPKDEISYRQATQLDPQDSIVFSALAYELGQYVEARRLPDDRVFSYRFKPTASDGLYANQSGWNAFWSKAAMLGTQCGAVLYCDIADFYNQIYHHSIENQLIASSWANQATKWVISLLESTTAGVSRGIPVGPHACHLLAEAALIPIDNSLDQSGLRFIRYADDIVIFCSDVPAARAALGKVAQVLDRQQRLTLQRHKTKIYNPLDFAALCGTMIQDRPINQSEADLLALVRKYSGGNPYKTVTFNQVSAADWNTLSSSTIEGIISAYLEADPVDYNRLRWFYRRLTQIGHPGAIEISLARLDELGPCLANICTYLSAAQSIDAQGWKSIGAKLLQVLEREEVRQQEFFRLSILSVFGRNGQTNHFASLAALYQQSDPFVRREILLAAKANSAFDWLREYKESFSGMDDWQKPAYLFSISGLPSDEKKFFVNRYSFTRPYELNLARWSKGQ